MNCKQVESLVSAYADGEVDPLRSYSIRRHLGRCPRCAASHADILRLRERIRAEVPSFVASPALAARVRAMASAAGAAVPAPKRPARERWAWLTTGAVAGCAATALSWTIGTAILTSRAEQDFAVAAVATHGRAALGNELVQIASSEHHTVKPWLSARLDYSPPVQDLAADGFPLKGGRIDTIGSQPVAVLVYGYGQHTIDVFVRPHVPGGSREAMRTERGFHVARASGRTMDWVAVSDAEPTAVSALVERLAREESAQ